MFRIELLPAEYGDALWIEYGAETSPHRVLIDCGTSGVYRDTLAARLEKLPRSRRSFELFVVTHIDADHIGGAIDLLRNREKLGVEFGDIWFNGFEHLLDDEGVRGPLQGERLTTEIQRQKLPWNAGFRGKAVVVSDPGDLPVKKLPGGMKLTLLSPYRAQLAELRLVWEKVIREAGLVPGQPIVEEAARAISDDDLPRGGIDVPALARSKFREDAAEANGSSIAFLAEYGRKSVLFGADAHAPVLLRSLKSLNGGKAVALDAFKIPHHGSEHNVSRELLHAVRCENYLISTNGKKFRHPSRAGIARIVSFGGGTLHFNYRTKLNDIWDDKALKDKHGYATRYPTGEEGGLIVELGSRG